jgi:hypothetical protein
MDKFSKWTGLAHATLIKHYPKFKRSQACECLAAWLGHRTYASLRVQDLAVLNKGVKHAIIDAQAAMARAESFGFPLTREQWLDVEWTLKPSGVSGMWLTEMHDMESAARLAFEDNDHPDANAIAQAIGMTDGRWCERCFVIHQRTLSLKNCGSPCTARFVHSTMKFPSPRPSSPKSSSDA